jgi:hypothetical protein
VVVVVVPVVVVPVVVVPVVVVVEPVVVVVLCCCALLSSGLCVLATAIDVANPATRSASKIAFGFMMAAFLQGGCFSGATDLDAAERRNLRCPAGKSLERVRSA